MKKYIGITFVVLLLGISLCSAQDFASPFNSIGVTQSKNNSKNRLGKEQVVCESNTTDSIENSQQILAYNEYANLPIDKLEALIGRYESFLNRQKDEGNKEASGSKQKKILSYYKGSPRELNLGNLQEVLKEVELSNHLFVIAQALLETGHFSSRVCKEYNNLFGLYDSRNHDYFHFARWEDSVVGYKRMIQYRYKGGNYLHFLKRIGYAEDAQYISKVAKIAKSIYRSLFANCTQ